MSQSLVNQDLIIVVAAPNHPSSILNPDFLKYSNIVPSDWSIARPTSNRASGQVTYSNGVSIVAEPNRVIFIQPMSDTNSEKLAIADIASKYTQTLPNIEFQAVGINPRGYVLFPGSQDAARKYITETLMSVGDWQSEGEEPMRASLNLVYKFKRAPFYLNVAEASLRNPDETSTPIVIFSGSFSYELEGDSSAEKLNNLHECIDNWQTDLQAYSDIVNDKFIAKLNHHTSIVPDTAPDLFAMSASA